MSDTRQRIDKWLWHTRVVRTRTAAADLAAQGYVRVNGKRIASAAYPVRINDSVTVALDRTVRIMRVAQFGERRGSPKVAQALYVDLSEYAGQASPEPGEDSGG